MSTLQEQWEQERKNHFEYCNIDKYHVLGFKGKDINFLNLELGNHGTKVCKVFSEVAPESKVFKGVLTGRTDGTPINKYGLTVNGVLYDFETFVVENNIKVINSSKTGGTETVSQFIKKYIVEKHDVIFTSSAGNSYGEVTCPYKNSAIVVGAVDYVNGNPTITDYSGKGEKVDFVTFAHLYNGTSFSAPFLNGMIALLLQRYGDFNQEQCIEILKSLCIDLGEKGKDVKYGWGLPVLPLTDKLSVLEDYKTLTIPEKPSTLVNKYYKVQIGAFKIKTNAQNLVSKLKLAGFSTYMPAIDNDGLYRVQCGAFVEKENAIKLQNQLIDKGFSGAFIVYK